MNWTDERVEQLRKLWSEGLSASQVAAQLGGVSRNAILRASHPTYVECGRGCRVTDLEGVTRIDFSNNMASLIHGHACPEIIHAVTEQMTRGTAFMMGTEIEVRYAEHLCSRNRSFEKMRFMNSGTHSSLIGWATKPRATWAV